jgi:hypothetical protein
VDIKQTIQELLDGVRNAPSGLVTVDKAQLQQVLEFALAEGDGASEAEDDG